MGRRWLAGSAGNADCLMAMTRTLLLLGLGLLAASRCNGGGQQAANGAIEVGQCHVGGCSGELCSSQEGLSSPCIYKQEYACYGSTPAVCEPQQDGQCDWTQSPELQACLQQNAAP
jgi:hypothetical protein